MPRCYREIAHFRPPQRCCSDCRRRQFRHPSFPSRQTKRRAPTDRTTCLRYKPSQARSWPSAPLPGAQWPPATDLGARIGLATAAPRKLAPWLVPALASDSAPDRTSGLGQRFAPARRRKRKFVPDQTPPAQRTAPPPVSRLTQISRARSSSPPVRRFTVLTQRYDHPPPASTRSITRTSSELPVRKASRLRTDPCAYIQKLILPGAVERFIVPVLITWSSIETLLQPS